MPVFSFSPQHVIMYNPKKSYYFTYKVYTVQQIKIKKMKKQVIFKAIQIIKKYKQIILLN